MATRPSVTLGDVIALARNRGGYLDDPDDFGPHEAIMDAAIELGYRPTPQELDWAAAQLANDQKSGTDFGAQ